MIDVPSEARSIERRLKDAGIGIAPVLAAAGLDRSTWTRWKAGTFKPRLESWVAMQNEALRLLAGRGQ